MAGSARPANVVFRFWGPFRSGADGGEKPEGRRARCAPFSDGTWMCRQKIPAVCANLLRCSGREGGVCFFGYFLCTSKESDSRGSAKRF
jgi:hypothetical protein